MRSLDVLLLLDNGEHLVDEVAPLDDAIDAGAPEVRLLVTSQVALKAECEHVFRLGPLAVPDTGTYGATGDRLRRGRAVRRSSAQARSPLPAERRQRRAVIELCSPAHGLALALKLAAGLAIELLANAGSFEILVGLQHDYRRRAVVLEPAAASVCAEGGDRYWLNRGTNSLPSYTAAVACARKAIAFFRSTGTQAHLHYMALLHLGWWGPVDEWEAAQAELDEIERAGCPAFLLTQRALAE